MKKFFEKLKLMNPKLKIALLVVFVCLAGGLAFWFLFYTKYASVREELTSYQNNPKLSAIKDKYDVIQKVASKVEVPKDEEPTVATISNVHRLQSQPFFANAKNGDKIIFYKEAKRAILYRPETNKIIEIASVNIEQNAEGDVAGASDPENPGQPEQEQQEPTDRFKLSADSSVQPETAQLAIYNGTKDVVGLASKTEQYLMDNIEGYELKVVETGNSIDMYDRTIVVAIDEGAMGVAQAIAELVGAQVVEKPAGEGNIGDKAHVLVIMGYNYNDAAEIIPE